MQVLKIENDVVFYKIIGDERIYTCGIKEYELSQVLDKIITKYNISFEDQIELKTKFFGIGINYYI